MKTAGWKGAFQHLKRQQAWLGTSQDGTSKQREKKWYEVERSSNWRSHLNEDPEGKGSNDTTLPIEPFPVGRGGGGGGGV